MDLASLVAGLEAKLGRKIGPDEIVWRIGNTVGLVPAEKVPELTAELVSRSGDKEQRGQVTE